MIRMVTSIDPADPAWCRDLVPAARLVMRRYGAAEDLAQEALVVTLEAVRNGKVTTRDEASAFMYGVCKNLVRAEARRANRREALLDRNAPMFSATTSATPIVDRERLWFCLNKLSARNRAVVLRSFVSEHDANEIASELELSPENVRVIRFRALATLRDCITGGAR